jgi:hypothetical protein
MQALWAFRFEPPSAQRVIVATRGRDLLACYVALGKRFPDFREPELIGEYGTATRKRGNNLCNATQLRLL